MTQPEHVRIAVDEGTASVAASLLARVDGAWRLLAADAAPAAVGADALARSLVRAVLAADPSLARLVGPAADAASLPRLVSRSVPPPGVAILAATERRRAALGRVARASGLTVAGGSDHDGPVASLHAALRPDVSVVLVGSARNLTSDERGAADELIALLGSIAQRRPEAIIVASGAIADRAAGPLGGRVVAAPPAGDSPADDLELRNILLEIALPVGATRRGIVASIRELALLLEIRVEVVEVGHGAGMRAVAWPAGEGAAASDARVAVVADAALVPADHDDDVTDGIAGWSTVGQDRVRLRDRLAELRLMPWGDPEGDGAHLRLAGARAAMGRLVAATADFEALPTPDLLVAVGGAWAAAPPPAVALALLDTVRHVGATQLAIDHARLLGPLGLAPDPVERRDLISGLVDDLLLPLGTVVVPRGIRAGRAGIGRLALRGEGDVQPELDLTAGAVHLVDLPPGRRAIADISFRDAVDLGVRARHFAVPVVGGLGGLLVDLRDVPLRLPSRPDRRREQIAAWQRPLWPDAER